MQILYFLLPTASALSPDDFLLVGDATRCVCYGLAMVMLFFGPLTHFKSGNLASLWSLVSFLLYTRWLAALNISTAPYLSAFQISLGRTLSPTNLIYEAEGKATSQEKIKALGAESVLFFNNSGLLLLILTGIALALGVVSLLGKGEGETCAHSLRRKMQYSALILALLISFQDLLIFALLQIQGAEFDSGIAIFSLFLSVIFVLFALIFTISIPIVLYKHQNSPQIRSKWAILTQDMKDGLSLRHYQHYSLYVLQRWVSSLLYVLLDSLPELQFSLVQTMEVGILAYMLYSRPYVRSIDNAAVALVQAVVCLLVLLEGCFYGNWSERGTLVLTFAFIGTFWLGILLCFLRFAFGFSCKKAVFPIEPASGITDTSSAELKTRTENTNMEDDKITCELPNNPYKQIAKPASPLRVKSLSKVLPVPLNTQSRIGEEG